ncbi:MAG: single-stranded DNA-binding protein [Crocosphaera sp.]
MNTCVLMGKVISTPELRYTSDTQTEVAQMLVEFEGRRSEDPPSTLKVVGWGNLATQMKETCAEGDRLILEGRLSMNTFERQEGFKEKRAELVISHLYPLNSMEREPNNHNVVPFETAKANQTMDNPYQDEKGDLNDTEAIGISSTNDPDDPIPF